MVDRIDRRREDDRRTERVRSEQKQFNQKKMENSREFQAQYKQSLKTQRKESQFNKRVAEAQSFKSKDGKKTDDGQSVLSKVLTAAQSKEEKRSEDKVKKTTRDEHFFQEETEKEDKTQAKDTKSKVVSEEGHLKVGQKESKSGEDGKSGGGSGGQQSKGQEGDDSSSYQGSFSGGDQSSMEKNQKETKKISVAVSDKSNFQSMLQKSQSESGSQGHKNFSKRELDKIVENVRLTQTKDSTSLEIELGDPIYKGLVLKAEKKEEGLFLTFNCPNQEIKNKFLLNRPLIYQRLREEKGLKVYRIDVI